MPKESSDPVVSDKSLKRIALAIAALTLLTFASSLGNDFVGLDDSALIYRNDAVLKFSWNNIVTVFTTYDPELYVPLTLFMYQVEHAIFRLNPFIFHLSNLLLHIGSTVILFFIIVHFARSLRTKITYEAFSKSDTIIAAAVAILFAIHPLQTEAVAWASARKDVLSAFLFFGSWLLFIRYRSSNNPTRYVQSLVLFLLGLLAKVSIIALPIVLLMTDWLQGRKIDQSAIKEKIPYFALSIVFGIVALFGKTSQITALTPWDQFLLSCKALTFYIHKLIAPYRLSVFYPHTDPISILRPEFFLAVAVVALLMAIMIRSMHRHRVVAFGIAFYVLMLLPSFLNFWKNGVLYFASDRYAYIGAIGLFFALAATFIPMVISRFSAVPSQQWKTISAIFVAFLVLPTILQAGTWGDSEALYRHALKRNPTFPVALNNLGSALYEKGDNDGAMEYYEQAIAADPQKPIVHINVGNLRRKLGDLQGAMLAYEDAVKAVPTDRPLVEDDLAAYYFLGNQYDEAGRSDDAIKLFELAVEKGPQFADAHYNLGVMYQKYRRAVDAARELGIYVEMVPRNVEARYRLAAVQAETGMFNEAIENLRYVVSRDPNYEKAQEHLQNLLRM